MTKVFTIAVHDDDGLYIIQGTNEQTVALEFYNKVMLPNFKHLLFNFNELQNIAEELDIEDLVVVGDDGKVNFNEERHKTSLVVLKELFGVFDEFFNETSLEVTMHIAVY